MRRVLLLVALLSSVASANPRLAVTTDDVRIDREIGDGDGWVDDLESAVAKASYDVFRTTGMNIRPRLGYLRPGLGGYETGDASGGRVYISRREDPETVAFTVFHEAGHVAYRHDRSAESQAIELSADEYAGRLVAATGGDIRAAIADYKLRGDTLHGTGQTRAAALFVGYLRNGGTVPPELAHQIAARLARLAPSLRRRKRR